MLYDLEWLKPGQPFPPVCEKARITRYKQNAALFDSEHFSDSIFRRLNSSCETVGVYDRCARRISKVIGNFEDVISAPVLLNYQRLMSMKIADLVCGEPPIISGATFEESSEIKKIRDRTDLDAKLYAAVIDISRFGEAIQRIYKQEDGNYTFVNWMPTEWFPIVSQDGTYTITKHCLCWIENKSKDSNIPDYYLHVQIHEVGFYEYRVYKMDSQTSLIGRQVESSIVPTGLDVCAVSQVRSFMVTGTVFGYDDYMPLDSILAEIMERIGQISVILDKHADPNITGPVSMLEQDPETGEYFLRTGKFYAVSPGEEQPSYMTWEGQLSAAFKQLEILINQLYILSEMGSALLGDAQGGSQAISGTAMRFKMAGPLSKARRIANSLTKQVRQIISVISRGELKFENISVEWSDGLPDDPRESIEMAKLATGETMMMPLKEAIMKYFGKSSEEADAWVNLIKLAKEEAQARAFGDDDPNKSGPQDGTGVNPNKKGSTTGLNNHANQQNRNQDTGDSSQRG